jgi:hypothetical protein
MHVRKRTFLVCVWVFLCFVSALDIVYTSVGMGVLEAEEVNFIMRPVLAVGPVPLLLAKFLPLIALFIIIMSMERVIFRAWILVSGMLLAALALLGVLLYHIRWNSEF